MENFSTPRSAWLPQTANLVTLVVLVAATWWSGAQRPADAAAGAAKAPSTAGNNHAAALPMHQPADLAPGDAAQWQLQANTLPRDGLQAVGYLPRTTR